MCNSFACRNYHYSFYTINLVHKEVNIKHELTCIIIYISKKKKQLNEAVYDVPQVQLTTIPSNVSTANYDEITYDEITYDEITYDEINLDEIKDDKQQQPAYDYEIVLAVQNNEAYGVVNN